MIPKIIRQYINPNTKNIIKNYITDDGYFLSKNNFILNFLKIGPFKEPKNLSIKFASLIHKSIYFKECQMSIINESPDKFFYLVKFNSNFKINFDISMEVKARKLKFSNWVNLWYTTLDEVSKFIVENRLHLKQRKLEKFYHSKTKPMSFVGMKNSFFDFEDMDLYLDEQFDKKNFNLKRKNSDSINATKEISKMMQLYSQGVQPKIVKKKKFDDSSNTMLRLIDALDGDHDLNHFIDGVNSMSSFRNVQTFDKENINIFLNSRELDKFSKVNNMFEEFCVNINFKII